MRDWKSINWPAAPAFTLAFRPHTILNKRKPLYIPPLVGSLAYLETAIHRSRYLIAPKNGTRPLLSSSSKDPRQSAQPKRHLDDSPRQRPRYYPPLQERVGPPHREVASDVNYSILGIIVCDPTVPNSTFGFIGLRCLNDWEGPFLSFIFFGNY